MCGGVWVMIRHLPTSGHGQSNSDSSLLPAMLAKPLPY